MKKKLIKEEFDLISAVGNFLGDAVRQAAGAVDFLGDPVIIAALYKNYEELETSLERLNVVKQQLLGPDMEFNYSKLKDEMSEIRQDLEVDIIDTLQGFIELTPTGPLGSLGSFATGLPPMVLQITLNELIDKIHTLIPKDLDFPLVGTLDKSLRGIYFIDNVERVQKEIRPIHDNPNEFIGTILNGRGSEMVQEGRKKTGTKLCSRGKSAAKSKFDVYPSAYANGYAIQVCKGKIKGLDGKKRCSPPYC